MAADLRMPVKAPPAPLPPIFSWTGLYLGIEGGGGWGSETWIDNSAAGIPPGTAISHKPNGGIFGGEIGYRYQISNNIVIGVEGTAAWADLEDTINTGNGPETENFKVRALYTATGQIGYAFNQALLYVKGGWAGANTRATLTFPGALGFTASNTQDNSGWTVGVGLDYALINNFVVGVEYDHFDLNYSAFTAPVSNGGTPWVVTNPSRLTIDQVVGRLSYKFNFGGPLATRY